MIIQFQLLMMMMPLYNYLRINNYNIILQFDNLQKININEKVPKLSYIYPDCLFHIFLLMYSYLAYDTKLEKQLHIL